MERVSKQLTWVNQLFDQHIRVFAQFLYLYTFRGIFYNKYILTIINSSNNFLGSHAHANNIIYKYNAS